jgi:uncharacterized membrane protein YjjP (DUF1212 family)
MGAPSGAVSVEPFADALVEALRRAGAPAHRLEATMEAFAAKANLASRFYILPTSILVADPRGMRLLPTGSGEPSIHRMADLDRLADDVAQGVVDPAAGLLAVRRIEAAGPAWGRGARLAAHAVAAGAVAPLVGGGPREAVAAALIGLVAGGINQLGDFLPRRTGLGDLVGAAAGTVVVAAVAHAMHGLDPGPALLAGLIVLLPGFRLTVGMTELATRHLLSGTGGLVSAGMTLLQLAVGVALGSALVDLGSAPVLPAPASPAWIAYAVLPALAVSFGVLLDARRSQLGHVLVAVTVALLGAQAGAWLLGPSLAGLIGAFAVTVTANTLARAYDQPAAVVVVPGILLLVPGSIGFRAVRALLEQDTVAGVEGAFAMVLAAATIVAGTLAGSALVPPRRAL